MTIELLFLKKAIEDRNYVSFSFEGKAYKSVKPFSIKDDILKCDVGEFSVSNLKKVTVLKERF